MPHVVLNVCCIILCISLACLFFGYKATTNKIIKEQEKEIARLRTQLKREKQRETLQVISNGKNPKFGGF